MDDIQLIQVIERYLANQMSQQEKAQFEKLRSESSEIDQMVVEHNMFLHQMENFSNRTNLKHSFNAIHNSLVENGNINDGKPLTTKAKVVSLFNKYKKVASIAAAVGGFIALVTSMMVSSYNNNTPAIEILSAIQKQNQKDLNKQNEEIKLLKSKLPANVNIVQGGSSFLIDGNGYLVTNSHVLDGANSAVVSNEEGKEYNVEIAYRNAEKDLAILKIVDEEFEPIKTLPYSIKKSTVDLGEELYTIGYPNYPRTDVVYNIGYLSSVKGFNGDTLTCQIQMNANHGNSGGPIFNKKGEVVGVLNSRLSNANGVTFAIRSKGIFQIIDELKEKDSSFNELKISSSSKLHNEDRVSQIKQVEKHIYMVKAYKK